MEPLAIQRQEVALAISNSMTALLTEKLKEDGKIDLGFYASRLRSKMEYHNSEATQKRTIPFGQYAIITIYLLPKLKILEENAAKQKQGERPNYVESVRVIACIQGHLNNLEFCLI